jgi:hypothetical protein
MDLLTAAKEFGPIVLLFAFFVWRDWKREERMARRLDAQWDELAKLQRRGNEVMRELCDVLRSRPCLADDDETRDFKPSTHVPRPNSDSDTHRIARSVAGFVLLGVLGALVACGGEIPDPRKVDPPPAAAEVADLRARELAAGVASAEARAAGDVARADYQAKLAAELGKLRAEADGRAAVQAADLARIEAAAAREVQVRAEAATAANDRQRARIIAGAGSALCVAAGGLGAWFGLARVALPLAGAGLLACLTLFAFAEATRVAWLAPVLVGGLVLAAVAWVLVRRRDLALKATADLADAFEGGVRVLEGKARAQAAQIAAGVHGVIERHRKARPAGSDHA